MFKSALSGRIDLCNSLSKLNKDGCLEVIRLLDTTPMESDVHDLNQLTIKIFMNHSNNWTIDQIIQFEHKMKQTLNNQNYIHSHSQSESDNNKSITNKNKDVQFPLLRLPIDVTAKTSLYLNEKDIFQFEKCCRLFYQIINNTSYLNLSNNFKTFVITNKTLYQMSQASYSFFKYSKTKYVKFCCESGVSLTYNGGEEIEKHFLKLNDRWEKAKLFCIKDGLFDNMFKSIEILHIHRDCMVLLDKLPIELLFDPNESHLNEIEFDHRWNLCDTKYLKQYINKFETEYSKFQRKLQKQGKQMTQLKIAKHDNVGTGFEGLSCIWAEHLMLMRITIDLSQNWLSRDYNPCLRKLTCDYNIEFENIIAEQQISVNNQENMNIETLRLRSFDGKSSCDIINNKIVIETLNLQNSVKNLMLNIDDQSLTQRHNVIEAIIKKEHFYKLENVIILLDVRIENIDLFFKMLTKNVQLLKYQFKQFIIGLRWLAYYTRYHVLEWNKNIDEQYLNELSREALCMQNNENHEVIEQMKQKYWLLMEKWSS